MLIRGVDRVLFTFGRLRQHKLLVGWVLVGLICATTLALSLSLYIDAVYSSLLASRLDQPPYAIRYRYLGSWSGNISQDAVTRANDSFDTRLVQTIGLPVAHQARFVRGSAWAMRGANGIEFGALSTGLLEGMDRQITIVRGEWPPNTVPAQAAEVLPVLVPETMLLTMGLQVGDELVMEGSGASTPIRVAALWRPAQESDPTWLFPPKYFDQILLFRAADFWALHEPIDRPISEAAWYLILDGASVRVEDTPALVKRIVDGQRLVETTLPGIRQDLSPVSGLRRFNQEVQRFTRQLYLIVAPVGGLAFYFVLLIAGFLVSRQAPDDVKLRCRGISARALLSVHVLMWLALAAGTLLIALAISPAVVQAVGRTASFMRFDGSSEPLDVRITPSAVRVGVVTGVIAASSGLFLAWRATRQDVNAARIPAARASQAWWRYLDIGLLLPASYVLYSLSARGGVVAEAASPFNDPLIFLGPTLFALAAILIVMRVWHWALEIGARVVSLTRNVSFLMVLRELTRSSYRYRGGLLMMSCTLSLSGFTASMANTLDHSLLDRIAYQVGADLVLVTAVDVETEQDSGGASGQATYTITGYNLPPIQELAALEGIQHISRVGRYNAQLLLGTQRIPGALLGVDRGSLPAIVPFRSDYAGEPLATLLNRLAGQRTGVLISRYTAEAYQLVMGQEIAVQVRAFDTWYDLRVPVMGTVDHFPTLDPQAGVFLIGNLDPIFELVGSTLPYDLWLSLSPGADLAAVRRRIEANNFPVLRWIEPDSMLRDAYADPARRGVLGFLSIGFAASITLTLIATISQNTASFRSQAARLGALRAMGLKRASVGCYVLLQQGLVTLTGIFIGTAVGVGTSLLFLPLLDFSGGIPPYLVRVAWGDILRIYGILAGILLVTTLFTALFLYRERLTTITRLGEA